MRVNEIAAYIHRQMVTDDRFGYSWEERHGANPETWTIDGKPYKIRVGDYDCSSSCITAWAIALRGTKYEGCLEGATYTGDMRAVFTGSGLFEWKPMSFLAEPGDLYLNEVNHVAMCQTQYPDVLSEFSWGDNGAYGNQRGDQSGYEAHLADYYDYPWDGILHYNGKADGAAPQHSEKTPSVRYAVSTDPNGHVWYPFVRDCDDFAGEDGEPIRWLAIDSDGWYMACTEKNGWLEPVSRCDVTDLENGCAGDGSRIIAVVVYYDTPDPASTGYFAARYRVRDVGNADYLDWQIDDDTDDGQDGFAGDFMPIDRFQMHITKA